VSPHVRYGTACKNQFLVLADISSRQQRCDIWCQSMIADNKDTIFVSVKPYLLTQPTQKIGFYSALKTFVVVVWVQRTLLYFVLVQVVPGCELQNMSRVSSALGSSSRGSLGPAPLCGRHLCALSALSTMAPGALMTTP
jgi:hypothetical protein